MKTMLGMEALEQIKEFLYLDVLVTTEGICTVDAMKRIKLASAVKGRLNKPWKY
jgi:hypothetical protein